ncbi:hypothetical protein YC2023_014384 [Brassica napus]
MLQPQRTLVIYHPRSTDDERRVKHGGHHVPSSPSPQSTSKAAVEIVVFNLGFSCKKKVKKSTLDFAMRTAEREGLSITWNSILIRRIRISRKFMVRNSGSVGSVDLISGSVDLISRFGFVISRYPDFGYPFRYSITRRYPDPDSDPYPDLDRFGRIQDFTIRIWIRASRISYFRNGSEADLGSNPDLR